jgi:hypothetical protein
MRKALPCHFHLPLAEAKRLVPHPIANPENYYRFKSVT